MITKTVQLRTNKHTVLQKVFTGQLPGTGAILKVMIKKNIPHIQLWGNKIQPLQHVKDNLYKGHYLGIKLFVNIYSKAAYIHYFTDAPNPNTSVN